MAIFGAVMASVAFFLCTWAPNVQVMILLYGLIGGEYQYFLVTFGILDNLKFLNFRTPDDVHKQSRIRKNGLRRK